ncbi:MAG: hypothetical protein AAGF59_11020 [Pseudomonadota bacterium]
MGFKDPSKDYQGGYLFEVHDTFWLFLASWLGRNASMANEPVANALPPPISLETLLYAFHGIDLYRRIAMESMLEGTDLRTPSIEAERFAVLMRAAVRRGDMRWLLPCFLKLMPGLEAMALEDKSGHLEKLAHLDLLLPGRSGENGDDYDLLVFGEAGRRIGAEYHRSFLQATGFQLNTRVDGTWVTAARGFLAPTALANNLVVAEQRDDVPLAVNYQAFTRDLLDRKMTALVDGAVKAVRGPDPEPEPEPAPTTMTCRSCGHVFAQTKKFCPECGAKVLR